MDPIGSGLTGWTCPSCYSFVPNGVTHSCSTVYGHGTNPTVATDPVVEKLDRIVFLLERIKGELETLRMRR